MSGVQNLTVLWTDVERVTAEMEQAVKAVVSSTLPEPGLLKALITDLQRLQKDCELVQHLSLQQEQQTLQPPRAQHPQQHQQQGVAPQHPRIQLQQHPQQQQHVSPGRPVHVIAPLQQQQQQQPAQLFLVRSPTGNHHHQVPHGAVSPSPMRPHVSPHRQQQQPVMVAVTSPRQALSRPSPSQAYNPVTTATGPGAAGAPAAGTDPQVLAFSTPPGPQHA